MLGIPNRPTNLLAARSIGPEYGTENGNADGNEAWRQLVRSEQMHAILRAAARGEPIPDSQWIQILSSLGDGLWQVRRRTPPEGYRQAIEQYQDRIRKLRSLEVSDTRQP